MSALPASGGDRSAKARGGWSRFWEFRGSTVPLALFRILFALILLEDLRSDIAGAAFTLPGGFHAPYLSLVPPPSEQLYRWIRILQVPAASMMMVGLFTRIAIGGLLVARGYLLLADQLSYSDQSYFLLLILLLLLFSPCDDAISVRRHLRPRAGQHGSPDLLTGSIRSLTSQRLIQAQVSIVYLYSILHKMNVGYFSGRAIADFAGQHLLHGLSGDALRALLPRSWVDSIATLPQRPGALIVPAVLIVLLESFVAVGLWVRRLRPLAIATGICFHLAIAWLTGIGPFSYAMIASYLLFLEPSAVSRRLATAEPRGRSSPPTAHGSVRI